MTDTLICEVCDEREAIGVAAVPGVPYSAAFCQECLTAGALPYWIAVSNTALAGGDLGLAGTVDWWQEVVGDTLKWLGKTREQFDIDVEGI